MKIPSWSFLPLLFLLPSPAAGQVATVDTTPYPGLYTWMNAARFRVYLHQETADLMIAISEEGVYPLLPQGAHTFGIEGLPGHEIAFTVRKGVARGIQWNLPSGKQFTGQRIKKLDRYAVDVDTQLSEALANDNFIVRYAPIDSSAARQVFAGLERHFIPLRDSFGLRELPQVTIKIFPTRADHAIGLNLPDRKSALLTATEFGRRQIYMTSPRTLAGRSTS